MRERSSPAAIIACGIMLQAFAIVAAAQSADDTLSFPDTANAPRKSSVHSLYAGAGYGSNMIYLGATLSQDHGFGYSSVSYGLFDKLYFTATGYTISGFSPFLAYYDLSVSFNHTFNTWFDISTSLSHYNVAESLRDTLFNNFTYADATLGFDWRILYTKISVGGLFDNGSQLFLQARNSRYFETPSFAEDKAFFSFDPYVNLLFGTMVSIETSEGTTTTPSHGYRPWRNNGQGSSTTYPESFGLMEIDFGLPIAFSYDFFTIELEPGYVLPLYSDTELTGMNGFLFMASAFFRIF
ncbi:MAG: hypothetical protein U5L72_02930 [Bacteroidales bacterium]|nr:hypothetical protein [Bacteroidales bacterium]